MGMNSSVWGEVWFWLSPEGYQVKEPLIRTQAILSLTITEAVYLHTASCHSLCINDCPGLVLNYLSDHTVLQSEPASTLPFLLCSPRVWPTSPFHRWPSSGSPKKEVPLSQFLLPKSFCPPGVVSSRGVPSLSLDHQTLGGRHRRNRIKWFKQTAAII